MGYSIWGGHSKRNVKFGGNFYLEIWISGPKKSVAHFALFCPFSLFYPSTSASAQHIRLNMSVNTKQYTVILETYLLPCQGSNLPS